MNRRKLEGIARHPVKRVILDLLINWFVLLARLRNIPRSWAMRAIGREINRQSKGR